MPAALPGTKHSKTLDNRELAIITAIQRAPGVRKVETGPFTSTGPTRQVRLQLRVGAFAGSVQGGVRAWLFIGAGKRHLSICPENGVGLETLKQELGITLAKYRVRVEIRGEEKTMTMDVQQEQAKECVKHVPTHEERWAYCEMIYEQVKTRKGHEEKAKELRTKLAELENTMQQVQQEALEILALLAAA